MNLRKVVTLFPVSVYERGEQLKTYIHPGELRIFVISLRHFEANLHVLREVRLVSQKLEHLLGRDELCRGEASS